MVARFVDDVVCVFRHWRKLLYIEPEDKASENGENKGIMQQRSR